MQTFAMISQFVLGLSIIVGIHELGHLLLAKLFGMRVESYTYGIGAIPLGGSVKIAGMIDESLDTESLKEQPQAWEFRAKPAWQRLIVILGGIILNVLSGIIIYITLTFLLGDTYLPKEEVNKQGIVPNELGLSLGFQEGDKIINISGKEFSKFADILAPHNLLQANAYYTVERDGQVLYIPIPTDILERLAEAKEQKAFLAPCMPFEIGGIQAGGGAQQAGLQPGDKILELAGQETPYFHQLQKVLSQYSGQEVLLVYQREQVVKHTTVKINQAGKLGFCPHILLHYHKQAYNLGQAMDLGTQRAFEVIKINVLGLLKVITGKIPASKSLSGPIGIAQIFGKQFDWIHFWNITGFLSMVLAFTNLLPIPALDGGHAVFIIYEIVTGRQLSAKFLETVQKIGLAILLFLISYAIFNDLRKLF